MKKRIKAHVRKKCRKCGTLLVNKPEYGAVCPKCGWCRGWYTDKDKVEGAEEMVTKRRLQKLESELRQLNGRIDRLTVFIDCDQGFSKLSSLEKYSLIMQRRGMKEYSYHLSRRINFYKRVRENINA